MRRTLAVLVTAGAFLVPAGAASAVEVEHTNASCSNGRGGNYDRQTSHAYNGLGKVERTTTTGCTPSTVDTTTGRDKDHGGSGGGSGGDPVVGLPGDGPLL